MNQKILIILSLFIICGVVGFIFFGSHSRQPVPTVGEKVVSEIPEDEEENATTVPYADVSFQHLIEREYNAPGFTQGEVLQTTTDYTKYAATYQSDTFTISGVVYIPKTAVPADGYPVLVTNHGYIDTDIYTTGRGLKREQEYFARRGFVVFHPDYRNHAGSSKTENDPIQDRLGYVTDIIHAVLSLQNSSLDINKNNITLLGHSMGGGATLAAVLAQRQIAQRIVLYAPVTVNYLDSYNRYQKNDPDRAELISTKYGAPEQNPDFWQRLNGEPYFDQLSVPVQIYHGTNDQDVPYDWSVKTRDALQGKNKKIELITYEGEGHEFSFAWEKFMQGVEAFIEATP